MAKPELFNTFNALSRRIDRLLEQQIILQKKLADLESSNNELKNQHEKDLLLLSQQQKQIEFLSLSHRLADSPEALIAARNKISKLIRTIDNCIRLINEEEE